MQTRHFAAALLITGTLLHASSRPYRTESAGTLAPSAIEIEAGSDWWSDKAAFDLNLKQGLTSRMDLGFHIPFNAFPDSTRAFGNSSLSAKFDLIPRVASVSFTGDLGGSSYALNGALSNEWGLFKASVDLGGHFYAGAREADLSWGLNPTYDFGPATLGAELRGNQHQANWWQLGGQLLLVQGIAIDAGLGDDFTNDHDWRVTTGFVFALPSIQ
jgi:hypothetical protein